MKRSFSEMIFMIFNTLLLSVLALVCLYPMLYVMFASFSNPMQFTRHTGLLFAPLGFTLSGYKLVLQNPNVLSGYLNTIFYVVAGTAVNMVMTCLGAYGFSRKKLMLGWPLFMLVLFTMYFSGGLIPSYLNIQNLGMINTRWAIIIPGAVSTYNMIITRTAFASLPASLEESARIDGANDFSILIRIVLP